MIHNDNHHTDYHDYQTNRALLRETDKKTLSYSRLARVPEPDQGLKFEQNDDDQTLIIT